MRVLCLLPALATLSAAAALEKRAGCGADNLLRNLRAASHTAEASNFCGAFLCTATPRGQPTPVSPQTNNVLTVTATVHPLDLYNIQHQSQQPMITYASPPTAVPVPIFAQCWGAGDYPTSSCLARFASVYTPACGAVATPTWLATTYAPSQLSSACSCLFTNTYGPPGPTPAAPSKTCTTVVAGYSTTTVPAFCRPAYHKNAPGFVSSGIPTATATATVPVVQDKLDCCQKCANTFNCVAWYYTPSTTFPPNAAYLGGFDPWAPGSCRIIYHTGLNLGNGPAAICPNGDLGEILSGSNNVLNGYDSYPYTNLFYNGWNEGPCGATGNEFQSDENDGRPDYYNTCGYNDGSGPLKFM